MTDTLRTRIAAVLQPRLLSIMRFPDSSIATANANTMADAVIEALEHQKRETCGGCRGLGGHSPRCHTQPGALWRRLADMAESLGDQIGGNDTTLANQAYDLMVSLRVRGGL